MTLLETEDRGSKKLVCPNTKEFKKRAQSLLVVVSSEPVGSYENFTERVRRYNAMKPFQFPLPAVFENKFNKVMNILVLLLLKKDKSLTNWTKLNKAPHKVPF